MYDSYRLQLLDERGTLVSNSSLTAETSQHYFRQLTPGKKYHILMQTISGGISSKDVPAEGRTCEKIVFVLVLACDDTADELARYSV